MFRGSVRQARESLGSASDEHPDRDFPGAQHEPHATEIIDRWGGESLNDFIEAMLEGVKHSFMVLSRRRGARGAPETVE